MHRANGSGQEPARVHHADVVDEGEAATCVDVDRWTWVTSTDGVGPAVAAHELAGARDLPDDDEGPLGCVVVHEPHGARACHGHDVHPTR